MSHEPNIVIVLCEGEVLNCEGFGLFNYGKNVKPGSVHFML